MNEIILKITLLSNAIFGKGDGVAGEVDIEIQHDELGCPFLSGKEIKGILVEECADILALLPEGSQARIKLENAACSLFGRPGSLLDDQSKMFISDAELPDDLKKALSIEKERFFTLRSADYNKIEEHHIKEINNLFRLQVLEAFTTIRSQTAMDENGVAKEHSLRSSRVILRNNLFVSKIYLNGLSVEESETCLALLSACVKAFRRVGNSRNRGLGKIAVEILDNHNNKLGDKYFEIFKQIYLMKEGVL